MPPSKLRHAAVDTASGGRSAILPLENEGRAAPAVTAVTFVRPFLVFE